MTLLSSLTGNIRDPPGVGLGGSLAPPPPTFWDGKIFLFYFGYPDLSLTTQTRFSNLTILNTHKQRTDIKLCLVAVANQCVATNDNRKGNFIGTFTESDLKMPKWHSTVASVGFSFKVYSFKFWSNVGARLNVTCCFKCRCNNNKQIYITIGSFRCIYSHFRRLKFEIFLGEHARGPP